MDEKNGQIKLSKSEISSLMFLRKIKSAAIIFAKSRIAKISLLSLILIFVLAGILSFAKSASCISEGDRLYKNMDYQSALEKYKLAGRWWIFDRLSPKFENNALSVKIKNAQIMIRSTDYYEQGKKDFEEGRYDSSKLNLSHLATNDPRNAEAGQILSKIQEFEAAKATSAPVAYISTSTSDEKNTSPNVKPKNDTKSTPTPAAPMAPEKQYNYDPYYPIILNFSDDRGNFKKLSDKNDYNTGQSWFYEKNNILKIGDTIHWKVKASDPKGRQIFYNFTSNSKRFNDMFGLENGNPKYLPVGEISYTIASEDIKSAGEMFRVVVNIKSDKDYYRINGSYDDGVYMDYKLIPE